MDHHRHGLHRRPAQLGLHGHSLHSPPSPTRRATTGHHAHTLRAPPRPQRPLSEPTLHTRTLASFAPTSSKYPPRSPQSPSFRAETTRRGYHTRHPHPYAEGPGPRAHRASSRLTLLPPTPHSHPSCHLRHIPRPVQLSHYYWLRRHGLHAYYRILHSHPKPDTDLQRIPTPLPTPNLTNRFPPLASCSPPPPRRHIPLLRRVRLLIRDTDERRA